MAKSIFSPDPQAFVIKLQYLALPLFFLAAGFAVCYSFLNWLLVASTGLVPLNENIVVFWLPGVLSGILVMVFIQPRLRVLKLSNKRNLPFLYGVIATAMVAAPAIIAQNYVKAASGELTHVTSAEAVASLPATKYYAADDVCLDRANAQGIPVAELAGSRNDSLNFYLYVAVPVCSGRAIDVRHRPVWIGLEFHKLVGAVPPDAEAREEFKKFADESIHAVNAEDPLRYRYLERLGVNADRRNFEKAMARGGVSLQPPPAILIPHTEPFDRRTGNLLAWIFKSFGIGVCAWIMLIFLPMFDHGQYEQARVSIPKPADGDEFPARALLVPHREMYGLPLLMDANIAVYLCMALAGLGVMSFQTDDLLAWGADYGPLIHGLGIFRLITSQFVHGGLMHLLNNLYGLIFAGLFLSPVARNSRLILFYVLCGLGGSVASVVLNPATVSVGASGAIFGLCGILLTLVVLGDARYDGAKAAIMINIGLFVGFNLLIGAASHVIDNAAHVGGLFTGAVLGVLTFLFGRDKPSTAHGRGCADMRKSKPGGGQGSLF